MSRRVVRGCEYYVEETGTGLHTVIFLHGLFLSGRSWHAQALALRNRYRCVALDFRGHARSSAPNDGYSMADLADDIQQLIESSGYGPCHLVGCAMGSSVALQLAIRRPELVRSLTLISPTPYEESDENKGRFRLLGLVMRLFGLRPVANKLMSSIFGEQFLNDTNRRIQVDHWRNEFRKQNGVAMARALKGYRQRDSVLAELRNITVPTLVMAGEKDTICPLSDVRALSEAIPHARTLNCPQAAHCPPVETPDEVSDALTGFLSSLQRRAR